MKSKGLWLATAALLASATVAPTLAQEEKSGAKGLFFQQLSNQAAPQNVGVQYWIELHKGGKEIRTNNKMVFHSGDAIRFHVTPNINGFAYIVLKSGSQGEHEVLFPVKALDEDNKVTCGKEIVLPTSGELKFDENAGIEKVSLILSRKPIDTEAMFSKPHRDEMPQTIAMVPTGSKDLIPSKVFVAYDFPKTKPIAPTVKPAAAEAPAPDKVASASVFKPTSKLVTKPPIKIATKPATTEAPKPAAPATKPAPAKLATKPTKHAVPRPVAEAPAYSEPPDSAESDSGIVTVVYNDPTAVLSADISLQHM